MLELICGGNREAKNRKIIDKKEKESFVLSPAYRYLRRNASSRNRRHRES